MSFDVKVYLQYCIITLKKKVEEEFNFIGISNLDIQTGCESDHTLKTGSGSDHILNIEILNFNCGQ